MGVFKKQGVYWIDYYVGGHRKRERIGPDKKLAETVLKKRKVEIADYPPQGGRIYLTAGGDTQACNSEPGYCGPAAHVRQGDGLGEGTQQSRSARQAPSGEQPALTLSES